MGFQTDSRREPLRDSSAAAIAVCGLQELLKQEPSETVLATGKETVLSRICTEDYPDFSESCPGVLKNAEVGDGVGKARSAYTSWGDYFLMEALNTELQLGETFW
jgi:unsaturated chondroitin disaccharide hydrolase